MSDPKLPTFDAFFRAVNDGRAPFPWQEKLAADVVSNGRWPGLLDLPTGVGKTSALDIAIYALAARPDAMPRRTVLVVDRRIVVDQAAEHAKTILRKLGDAEEGPCRIVADRLRSLFGAESDDAPFAVAVMRGGMPRDNDWAKRPDQPVLGVSTVDQVGSRLLFRGYGVGTKSASIHAGLLANDTLILLDEVHLAAPFAQTLASISENYRRAVEGLPDRFGVVQMSATPRGTPPASRRGAEPREAFRLGADDRLNPVLSRRLAAKKTAMLLELKVTGSNEALKRGATARRAIEEALKLITSAASVVGIVVNRVDTARLVARVLRESHIDDVDAILVTGRMRPLERDALVRRELLPRSGAGRVRSVDTRPLIVVATQCIEAGADLDFDALVTECASLDALRQRFGRVDRRGDLGETRSVILARSDTVAEGADDPVYGTALAATWRWLLEASTDAHVDFGIEGLPSALDADGKPRLDLLAPALDAPVLLPAHLDAWAQTSPRPTPDHDVSLWLHGPKRAGADVQIVWRSGIAACEADVLVARLSACRPSSLEAVTVPIGAARKWLEGDAPAAIADVLVGDVDDAPDRYSSKEGSAEDSRAAFRWGGDEDAWISAKEVRPGDVLIVDASLGGLTDLTFDPEGTEPVSDLGDLAQLRGRGIASLRLERTALEPWELPPAMLDSVPGRQEGESPYELRARIVEWLELIPESTPSSFPGLDVEWSAARESWRKASRLRLVDAGGQIVVSALVAKRHLLPELTESITEDDDSSFRSREVTLARHSSDVRTLAERFARAVGFGAPIAADIALAAWLHDIGKADPRFQRWLAGGGEIDLAMQAELLAKSRLAPGDRAARHRARLRAGYPAGYRHELLSVEMIVDHPLLARANDRDLVLHLVGSHHGWCRPFAPPIDDSDAFKVELTLDGHRFQGSSRHGLAKLDSGVADRYWGLVERYGWWGLAWLEAVLRLADHRASERESVGSS